VGDCAGYITSVRRTETVLALRIGVCVAVAGTVSGLDAAQGSVWVVRGLEGSLCGLGTAVGRCEVSLFFTELLAIAANDDARIEGQQEEDHKRDEEGGLVGREWAGATGTDLLGGLSLVLVALGVLVGALDDGSSGCALVHALGDEAVLEWLVEERNGECDEVGKRHEELEPEEDRKGSYETSGADEGSDEASQGDECEEGVDHTGYDETRLEVVGNDDTGFGTLSEGEPEEAGDDTGCDEGPKAEEEDTESDGDAEAEVSGPGGVGDSHDDLYVLFFLEK
jgi:hypothetical protein